MKKEGAYERYKALVDKAQALGHSIELIVAELRHEEDAIWKRCRAKQAQLATTSRTPYPAREAARAAQECVMVIERICKELEAKEITA